MQNWIVGLECFSPHKEIKCNVLLKVRNTVGIPPRKQEGTMYRKNIPLIRLLESTTEEFYLIEPYTSICNKSTCKHPFEQSVHNESHYNHKQLLMHV